MFENLHKINVTIKQVWNTLHLSWHEKKDRMFLRTLYFPLIAQEMSKNKNVISHDVISNYVTVLLLNFNIRV